MTAVASQYYSKLPSRLDASYVLMIDPMLATGGSAVAALDLLHAAGGRVIRMICIVAAPEGVALVERHHPGVDIYTPVVDRQLDAQKYIVPGLGDFGVILFVNLFDTLQGHTEQWNRFIMTTFGLAQRADYACNVHLVVRIL